MFMVARAAYAARVSTVIQTERGRRLPTNKIGDTVMFTKIAAALVITVGLFVGATTTVEAQPFTYGEQSYLDVMHAGGYYNENGDAVMVQLGYTICTWIATGWTFEEVVEKVWNNTPLGYGWYDSGYMVGAAHDNLCPSSTLV